MATQRSYHMTVRLARRYEFVAEFNDLPDQRTLRASAMRRAGSDVAVTTIGARRVMPASK